MMRVPKYCQRCSNGRCFLLYPLVFTGVLEENPLICCEIFMPADIVRASAGLLTKSNSCVEYGCKPPNDRLQIANLHTQKRKGTERDDFYDWALATVGYAAICDEVNCRYDTGARCCFMRRHTLPWTDFYGRLLPGLSWTIWDPKQSMTPLKDLAFDFAGYVSNLKTPEFHVFDPEAYEEYQNTGVILAIEDGTIYDQPHKDDPGPTEPPPGLAIPLNDGPLPAPPGLLPAVGPVSAALPPPTRLTPVEEEEDIVLIAERETTIQEQMAAHIENDVLKSRTVIVEHGPHVQDDKTVDPDPEMATGVRTARSRFPQITEEEQFLFNGDSESLIASEALRNKNVGVAKLTPRQELALTRVEEYLKKHMFNERRVKRSEREITRTIDTLPRKMSEEEKMQAHLDAANCDQDGYVPFSLLVDAFCKSEVTGKPKPRPIANHGTMRLFGIAKTAWVFEDLMFHALPEACIKHCEKFAKMNQLFSNCERFKGIRGMLENDMTAFEFGIHERLKEVEKNIIKHIMSYLDLEGDGEVFCERVVDARDKSATWVFRYKDAAGASCCTKLKLPRPMRESGDRITSSGNFLQNLIAWLVLLVHEDHVEAAIQNLMHHEGQKFQYTSARDGRKYFAFLAFEGDDTLGCLTEPCLLENNGAMVNDFFKAYGWNAKLKVAKMTGEDCLAFVGFVALVRDNKLVRLGENIVMFPDIVRILRTKSWATTQIDEEEYWPSVAIYATYSMNQFRYFAPMYQFFWAMREMALSRGGVLTKSNAMLRDCYLNANGTIGTEEEILSNIPEPETLLHGCDDFYALARVHAGEFEDDEIAGMCGLTTLEYHGMDLACYVPSKWLSKI